jgi:hypothetical protein
LGYVDGLVNRYIKVERVSPMHLTVSTCKAKPNGKPRWRAVHSVDYSNSANFSFCREGDSGFEAEIRQELIWKVLDNRTYFDACRSCAKLQHVDEMDEQLCRECKASKTDKKQWHETKLINSFIKPFQGKQTASHIDYFKECPEPLNDNCGDVLGLAYSNINWNEPHEPTDTWKVIKQFDEPISPQDSDSLNQAFRRILNNRNYFHFCLFCGEFDHKDHLSDRMCHSCMHTIHGVLF